MRDCVIFITTQTSPMKEKKDFIAGIHYYLEEGRVIFTKKYLADKKMCCGEKCRHCPYLPKHKKGSKDIDEFGSGKEID